MIPLKISDEFEYNNNVRQSINYIFLYEYSTRIETSGRYIRYISEFSSSYVNFLKRRRELLNNTMNYSKNIKNT